MAIVYIGDVPLVEPDGEMFLITGKSGAEDVQIMVPPRVLALFAARASRVFQEEMARRFEAANIVAFPKKKRRKRA